MFCVEKKLVKIKLLGTTHPPNPQKTNCDNVDEYSKLSNFFISGRKVRPTKGGDIPVCLVVCPGKVLPGSPHVPKISGSHGMITFVRKFPFLY
jgi:hypothetical protein